MWKSSVVCLALLGVLGSVSGTTKLQERYSWRQLDFVFPNQQLKQQALASGDYVPTNGLPVGIERWENKLFVSVPRWKDGNYLCVFYLPKGQCESEVFALRKREKQESGKRLLLGELRGLLSVI